MYCFITIVNAYPLLESILKVQNQQIYPYLKSLSQQDQFGMVKMAFTDKCPTKTEKCAVSTCTVTQTKFQGKDGYIDLRKVQESYSPTITGGSAVWMEVYNLAKGNETMEKIVSGLHFSVSTHIAAFHTKLFGMYFRNPMLFKKKYKQEYNDNFLFLYSTIRFAIATLPSNDGEVADSAKDLGRMVRKAIYEERDIKKSFLEFKENFKKTSLFDRETMKDVENTGDNYINEQSSNEEFFESLPNIDKEAIETINEMVKHIACLTCDKCKLWGTIQVKGIKSAIKALNGMPLFGNEVIYLINLFTRLSTSMIESEALLNTRLPYKSILVICHRQVAIIAITALGLSLGYLRMQKKKKLKVD